MHRSCPSPGSSHGLKVLSGYRANKSTGVFIFSPFSPASAISPHLSQNRSQILSMKCTLQLKSCSQVIQGTMCGCHPHRERALQGISKGENIT